MCSSDLREDRAVRPGAEAGTWAGEEVVGSEADACEGVGVGVGEKEADEGEMGEEGEREEKADVEGTGEGEESGTKDGDDGRAPAWRARGWNTFENWLAT